VILASPESSSMPEENRGNASVHSSMERQTHMSEPISEPVSPITASGDRFSMDCEESEPGVQEDVSTKKKKSRMIRKGPLTSRYPNKTRHPFWCSPSVTSLNWAWSRPTHLNGFFKTSGAPLRFMNNSECWIW
jgi:hypothetical protein